MNDIGDKETKVPIGLSLARRIQNQLQYGGDLFSTRQQMAREVESAINRTLTVNALHDKRRAGSGVPSEEADKNGWTMRRVIVEDDAND